MAPKSKSSDAQQRPTKATKNSSTSSPPDTTLGYLDELRTGLLRTLMAVTVIFGVLCFFSRPLFHFLTLPLLQYLPQGQSVIATRVTAPFRPNPKQHTKYRCLPFGSLTSPTSTNRPAD